MDSKTTIIMLWLIEWGIEWRTRTLILCVILKTNSMCKLPSWSMCMHPLNIPPHYFQVDCCDLDTKVVQVLSWLWIKMVIAKIQLMNGKNHSRFDEMNFVRPFSRSKSASTMTTIIKLNTWVMVVVVSSVSRNSIRMLMRDVVKVNSFILR
jgi:hypothetical protein